MRRELANHRTGDHPRPHVVIIGGGFAGLAAAKRLGRGPVRVTVVDRKNHHLFQPLLYQVATAGLSAPDIASPIRKVLQRYDNTRVIHRTITDIDAEQRRVRYHDGELAYDYLIVAAGMRTSYFGNDAWEAHAPGLKTIEDALEIRRRVLAAYEEAELEQDPERRRQLLTFVVVGAGPTGVELAGALNEISRKTMHDNFRSFEPELARVILLEGLPRVLPQMSEKLGTKALHHLRRKGVEVVLGKKVASVDARGVVYGQNERIDASTVIWAAGVKGVALAETLGVDTDRSGRIPVSMDLSLPGRPEVFVAGDLAQVEDTKGVEVPGLAPAANQMGRHAAENVLRLTEGRETEQFTYRDKGAMATLGRAAAVVRVGKLEFAGLFAWLMWLFVHIMYLVGFRNRVVVFIEWLWAYLTWNRGSRIILEGGNAPTGGDNRTVAATPIADAASLSIDSAADDSGSEWR